jgi:hypothetical protein
VCFPTIKAIETIRRNERLAVLDHDDAALIKSFLGSALEVPDGRKKLAQVLSPEHNPVLVRFTELASELDQFEADTTLRHTALEMSGSCHTRQYGCSFPKKSRPDFLCMRHLKLFVEGTVEASHQLQIRERGTAVHPLLVIGRRARSLLSVFRRAILTP